MIILIIYRRIENKVFLTVYYDIIFGNGLSGLNSRIYGIISGGADIPAERSVSFFKGSDITFISLKERYINVVCQKAVNISKAIIILRQNIIVDIILKILGRRNTCYFKLLVSVLFHVGRKG